MFNYQKIMRYQSQQEGFDKGSGLPSIAIQPIIPADHKGRLFLNLWQLWNSVIHSKVYGTLVPSLHSVAPELKRYV